MITVFDIDNRLDIFRQRTQHVLHKDNRTTKSGLLEKSQSFEENVTINSKQEMKKRIAIQLCFTNNLLVKEDYD